MEKKTLLGSYTTPDDHFIQISFSSRIKPRRRFFFKGQDPAQSSSLLSDTSAGDAFSTGDSGSSTHGGGNTTGVVTAALSQRHPIQTHSNASAQQPKVFKDETIRYDVVRRKHACMVTLEPTSYTEALEEPCWKQAMDQEFTTLLKNETWHLVPPDRGQNVIDCKWVFKLKRKADGSIDCYKARLVAKGFK
uniref:PH01B019A14.2 protein n=1 Tax=Phyllostachys edulis TaxID=38705 RepID=L0P3R4_PHYED|nr:PH01B019A14.2 [Phyllostachys edulis]